MWSDNEQESGVEHLNEPRSSKGIKRWRLSDIVRAALGANHVEAVHEYRAFCNGDLKSMVCMLNITLPKACGLDYRDWWAMTHEQRCDELVAVARRLKVPRRG